LFLPPRAGNWPGPRCFFLRHAGVCHADVHFAAIVSLAIPLFVVTMASQNLPGVAAIYAAGYGPDSADGGIPVSKIITLSGLATLVLAPFGAFALNLSAITAAICMGKEAHEDPAKRYTAAVCCGAIYIVIGIFGAAITGLLTAFPKELVVAIAGLALLGTIGSGLAAAVKDESHREAALITFLVTLSGVVIAGWARPFGVWSRARWRCLYNNTASSAVIPVQTAPAIPEPLPNHEPSFCRRSA
jgi:predicted benzoate:H+ symporter BenE